MNEDGPFFFFSVRALVVRLAVFSLGMVAVVDLGLWRFD
jgi:hypothetical protein